MPPILGRCRAARGHSGRSTQFASTPSPTDNRQHAPGLLAVAGRARAWSRSAGRRRSPLPTRLAQALAVPHVTRERLRRDRRRPRSGRATVRAQPDTLARAGVEREAGRHLRGARELGPRIPDPHRGARRSGARSTPSGTATCAQGRRRPDALDAASSTGSRGACRAAGSAASRARHRRRVVLRLEAQRARLEASFYISEWPPLSALVVDRAWYDNHYAARPGEAPPPARSATAARASRRDDAACGCSDGRRRTRVLASDLAHRCQIVLTAWISDSDNFTAELLLKTLGAENAAAPARPPPARRSSAALEAAGISVAGVASPTARACRMDDRLTARALVELLVGVSNDPRSRRARCARCPSPASAARSNDRMREHRRARPRRAKTGTTDVASSLSGYATRHATPSRSSRTASRWRTGRGAQGAGPLRDRARVSALHARPRGASQVGLVRIGTPAFCAFVSFEPGSRRRRRRSSSSTRSRRPSRRAPRAPPAPPRARTTRACR